MKRVKSWNKRKGSRGKKKYTTLPPSPFPLSPTFARSLVMKTFLPHPQSPVPITPYPQRGPRVPQSLYPNP
ncbi:hypothetical protein FDUTEX481_03043 [Tolypothrix sp. PCC 7601]|nr:hypothetical protein FDUTEX481_03043 [Tolypothrix sp. PCC 7601]